MPATQRAASEERDLQSARGLRAPWLVKPGDNQSGRGVSVVRHASQLAAAVTQAFAHSPRHEVLIQEFVAGAEVIVDSIVRVGVVRRSGIAAKTPYVDNPTMSSSIT